MNKTVSMIKLTWLWNLIKAKTNSIYTNINSEGESQRPQLQWNKYTHGAQNHNNLLQVKRSYLFLNEEEKKQENEKEKLTETRIITLDGKNDRKLVDLSIGHVWPFVTSPSIGYENNETSNEP